MTLTASFRASIPPILHFLAVDLRDHILTPVALSILVQGSKLPLSFPTSAKACAAESGQPNLTRLS